MVQGDNGKVGTNKKLLRRAFIAVALIVISLEFTIRAAGLVDVPIYKIGSDIQYIPQPNQSGTFLDKNDWHFNNLSMPIGVDFLPTHPSIFLIGNSIVMGGQPYKQKDKLTPQMQSLLGHEPVIWPIATGGWTEINEIAYLSNHREIEESADYIVWEYMTGGLSRATPWAGEYTFPIHKPAYATYYVLRRYVMPRVFPSTAAMNELPVTGEATKENIDKFDAEIGHLTHHIGRPGKGFIWLYPDASQLKTARDGAEWLPERHTIEELAQKHGLRIVDIATMPEWKATLYREGIHPTVEGNRVLATILAREIMKDQNRAVH